MKNLFRCPACRNGIVKSSSSSEGKCDFCKSEYKKDDNKLYYPSEIKLPDEQDKVKGGCAGCSYQDLRWAALLLMTSFCRLRTRIDYPGSRSRFSWELIANNLYDRPYSIGRIRRWISIYIGRDFANVGLFLLFVVILGVVGYNNSWDLYFLEHPWKVIGFVSLFLLVFYFFTSVFDRSTRLRVRDDLQDSNLIEELIDKYTVGYKQNNDCEKLVKEWDGFLQITKEEFVTSFFRSSGRHYRMEISRNDAEKLGEWVYLLVSEESVREFTRKYNKEEIEYKKKKS